ncbi:MAG: hypothetical protein U0599_28440 [Vicinamibacteria bacterium]
MGAPSPAPAPGPRRAAERRRFHTATGAVESYDPATRVLVVLSAGRAAAFVVAPEARLWIGSRRASVDLLCASTGAQATIAWSEADGRRTTHTVRLARGRGERDGR